MVFGCQENKRKKREKRANCDLKIKLRAESFNESLGYKSYKVAYIAIQNVKYQKYLKHIITIGIKWELYKTRSFGTKTQGEDFRYVVNFAIIAKISL